MIEQSFFLYDPETDVATLIDTDKNTEELGLYLACLATGLEGSTVAIYNTDPLVSIIRSKDALGNLQINKASTLLNYHNQERVLQGVTTAAREHRLSARAAFDDIDLLIRGQDSVWLLNKDGILYDNSIEPAVEMAAHYYDEGTPEDAMVRQLMDSGIDEVYTGSQFEFEPNGSFMQSERGHVSLGFMRENEYVPLVTILSGEHPVRQLIEGDHQNDQPSLSEPET